jgi:hypothetical protein
MVRLQMSPTLVGSHLTLGPAPWFRVERNELRQGPTESLVGELQNHQWNVRGRNFTVVEVNPGATLQFAGPAGPVSPAYGPYHSVRLADGSVYGDGQLIARFDDETYLWRCADTQQAWPAVVVSSEPA